MTPLLEEFRSNYSATQDEELGLEDYLELCKREPAAYATKFSGKYTHRTISGGVGHNLPQEAPKSFVDAILEVDGFAS